MDGQEIGKSYTYYFGSVARSDNINQLFHNEYGEDTVFGKTIRDQMAGLCRDRV